MKLCKNSFGRLVAFILCFVMTFTFIPFIDSEGTTVNAETQTPTIQLGDYVQMGTYYGEPILWRCVGFYRLEDDGITVDLTDTKTEYQEGYLPLMLSDKILCLKAFDAKGEENTEKGSHGRGKYTKNSATNCYSKGGYRQTSGSNYWGDSNIRCWLNSSEESVNWTCENPPSYGNVSCNPYDTEAGFLSNNNFKEIERCCMKTVIQDQLLDQYEYDEMDEANGVYGTEAHKGDGAYHNKIIGYYYKIENCVSNFEYAYKEKTEDTMFLLDVNQVYGVYYNGQDGKILGAEYYRGKPTAKCVEKSQYKDKTLIVGQFYRYWLRSPAANVGSSNWVRIISTNDGNRVYNDGAYYGYVGIRPAFYMNLSSANFLYGDGSEDTPYSLDAGPTVTVNFDKEQTNQKIDSTILYKKQGDAGWTSGSKTGGYIKLEPGKTYYFTYATKASAVTVITIPATPQAPTVESQTDTTVTLSANSEYEYKCDVVGGDEGNWKESNVFTGLTAGKSYTFYQRVKATGNSLCSFTSTGNEVAIQFAAPTVSYRTLTSITLKPIDGYLYKCGENGDWKESNVFENLKVGQTYTFYQKKEGTTDEKYTSEPLEVKTLTYGDVITSAVGITGVTAYLVAAAKNKLISKWFLTSNGIFGKKMNSWVKNFWTNMMR